MLYAGRVISVEAGAGVKDAGARLVLTSDTGRHAEPVATIVALHEFERAVAARCPREGVCVTTNLRHSAVVVDIDADDASLTGAVLAVLDTLAQPPQPSDADVARAGDRLERAGRRRSPSEHALALAAPMFFLDGYWSPVFDRRLDGYRALRGSDVAAALRDLRRYRGACFVGSAANVDRIRGALSEHSLFAGTPALGVAPPFPPAYPTESRAVTAAAPDAQAHLLLVGAAPAATDRLFPAALVANDVLGGAHADSLLVAALRRGTGLAYAASSFFRVLHVPTMWCIFVSCPASVVNEVRRTVCGVVAELPELLERCTPLPAFARAVAEERYAVDMPRKRLDRAVMRECLALPTLPLTFPTDRVDAASLRECGRYFASIPLQTVELCPSP